MRRSRSKRVVPLGRRPKGTGNPRAEILRAAQREFGERGFDRTSMRAVAGRARVNSALVYHYFGSKDGLFRESLRHMMRPPPSSLAELAQDGGDVGTGVARIFLERWSGGDDSMAFRGLLRSASTSDEAASILSELIARLVTPYTAARKMVKDIDRRVALVASALLGAGLVRFVVELPGLASPTTEEVAGWIGPTITRYLQGTLQR